ncbi:hypothetical protein AB0J72_46830 [Dactylosporangium sp. NPDC049742]|uniref:hypothetical protein n=1 Tax=Dactylosporangium sp. NPDC049742 TaxID=3154737 RepID=UPI00342BDDE6
MAAVNEPTYAPEPDSSPSSPRGKHGELKSDGFIRELYADRPAVAELIIAVREPIIAAHGWNGTFQRHAKLLKQQLPDRYGAWKSRELAKKCRAAFTGRLGPQPWMIADVLRIYIKDDKERATLRQHFTRLADEAARQGRRLASTTDRADTTPAGRTGSPSKAAVPNKVAGVGKPAAAMRAPIVTKALLSEQLTEATRRITDLLEQQTADRATIVLLRSKMAALHHRRQRQGPAATRRRTSRRTPEFALISTSANVPRQLARHQETPRTSVTVPGGSGTTSLGPAASSLLPMGLKPNELLRLSPEPAEDPLPFSRSSGLNRAMLVLGVLIVTVMILWVTVEQVF